MKKKILTVCQILVTLGILGWIFHDPQKRADMLHALQHADLKWVLAGILAYGVVELLGATRWQVLLKVQGIVISWFRLVKLLMIGILFNQLMPGGTGGDFVKIFYLLKEVPSKKAPQALLAVLMDRLVGLVGLIFVASAIIIVKWNYLTQGKPIPHFEPSWLLSFSKTHLWLAQIPFTTQMLYILLAILCFTILGLLVSFLITGMGLTQKLPAKFPKRDIFVDLSIAYNQYAKAWPSSLAAIFISFGVHIFSFMSFYSAARAIGAMVPVLDFCSVMPIINTLTSLPISVGGAGVREQLFAKILPELTSISAADATVISLLGYAIMVFWGLWGGLVYVLYRSSDHVKLGDITKHVEKLEHDIAEGEKSVEGDKPDEEGKSGEDEESK
jgi:glycosyltransferase 2 family protein